jgi:hypothetical protein
VEYLQPEDSFISWACERAFPELFVDCKPFGVYDGGYWFELSPEGNAKRVEILIQVKNKLLNDELHSK